MCFDWFSFFLQHDEKLIIILRGAEMIREIDIELKTTYIKYRRCASISYNLYDINILYSFFLNSGDNINLIFLLYAIRKKKKKIRNT